jgi:hypothetical protein
MMNDRCKLWIGRLLIGWVLLTNIQCAALFVLFPGQFVQSFELTGSAGVAVIQGFGILFLMWNVPYCVALLQPRKYRLSLLEAIVMQAIGFVGETIILLFLPLGHAFLRETVSRFIIFDGIGLFMLLLSVWITLDKVKLISTNPV